MVWVHQLFMTLNHFNLSIRQLLVLYTVVPVDFNTLWLEHFPIWTRLANKFWPPIQTRPLNSNTKTCGSRRRLPASQPVLLTLLRCEHLSLLRLRNGFQVTPAPSCLGYTSPQPWSLLTCHNSQCNAAFYSGHWQTYLLMNIYLTF